MGRTLFILKENQIKKIIGNILLEQQRDAMNYVDHFGSTSAVRVTHALLTTNFGLPDGANHENYYYTATTDAVLDNSKGSTKENLLSIFQPYKQYDPKTYVDYFSINNERLTNKGKKQFFLKRGDVIVASHNGLLAIARAMINMKGKEGDLTINFGEITKNELAKPEMISRNIILDSEKVFDLSTPLRALQGVLAKYATTPYFYERLTFDNTGGLTSEQLDSSNFFQKRVYGIVSGINSFARFDDEETQDEVQNNLRQLGLKTNIGVDFNAMIDEIKTLQTMPDFYQMSKDINKEKMKKMDEIYGKYKKQLEDAIRATYIENFKLFVKTYLPKYQQSLFGRIDSITLQVEPLSKTYYNNFYSTSGVPIKQPSSGIKRGQYKPGA
jgi:hypothetical protein